MTTSQPVGWTATQLVQAVAREQLELHYQPIIDLRSGEIAGAEALLRWQHPSLGRLPPGQFLPLAESSGLIVEIGAWVLDEACRQMREWQMVERRPFRLAVNVSARQVGLNFDAQVKRALGDAGLAGEYLEVELTESVAFGNPAIFSTFESLRAIGVRFAADDFGTGYSCLKHLKCCPITTLKIDQSFVAGLADDARDRTIVRTVIQLAHGLGMSVVADDRPAEAFARYVSRWRSATMNADDLITTSCCVCCKEIPLDAAFTPEGAEYVQHFCGLDCYERFKTRARTVAGRDTVPVAVGSNSSA